MYSQIRRRRPVLLASQLCFELLAVVKADSAAPNKRKEVITKEEEEEEIPRAAGVPYLTAVVVTGPNISFLPSREKSTRPITQAN